MHSLTLKKLKHKICYFDKVKKLNMCLIYFLSTTQPGTVFYNTKYEIKIQSFFPNHIFKKYSSLQDVWDMMEHKKKYLVLDNFNAGHIDFINPDLIFCKIRAGNSIYGKVLYPARGKFMGKSLYQIFAERTEIDVLSEQDIQLFHLTRCIKHTVNCPGLKKYCRCKDCWIELTIIRNYINNHNMLSQYRNLLYTVRVILKKINDLF